MQAVAVVEPIAPRVPAPVVDTDEALIAGWLGKVAKSGNTRRAYKRDLREFLEYVECKPLRAVTMSDVQGFAASMGRQEATEYVSLDGRAPATHARVLAVMKSLLSFAARLGYLPFNVGGTVSLPQFPDKLAERILPKAEVFRMFYEEPDPRNRALLVLLYATGGRIAEVARLTWANVSAPDGDGPAYVTLYGKGGKTRTVAVPATVWAKLDALRGDASAADPVFRSRKGGPLGHPQIWRIVRAAALRAGIEGNVSPHWLRHCCASHALSNGADVATVKETLGHSSLATTTRYIHAKPQDGAGLHLGL